MEPSRISVKQRDEREAQSEHTYLQSDVEEVEPSSASLTAAALLSNPASTSPVRATDNPDEVPENSRGAAWAPGVEKYNFAEIRQLILANAEYIRPLAAQSSNKGRKRVRMNSRGEKEPRLPPTIVLRKAGSNYQAFLLYSTNLASEQYPSTIGLFFSDIAGALLSLLDHTASMASDKFEAGIAYPNLSTNGL